VGLFQTADELRRTQRFAYRMRQIQSHHPSFGARSKEAWQADPLWQPAREAVERMLVTFDFGEALVALNLSFKPVIDELLMNKLGELAVKAGDPLLRALLSSLYEDSAWQREWTAELFKMLFREREENRAVVAGWLAKWHPITKRAAAAFQPIWGAPFGDVAREIDHFYEGWLGQLGLAAPTNGAP
jgi:toluene monooxygenase system protein E